MVDLELGSYELRTLLGALRETRLGPRDSNLRDAFERVTGLSQEEAKLLTKSLLDRINRRSERWVAAGRPETGFPLEMIAFDERELGGLLRALQHCMDSMGSDFHARMDMDRGDARELHGRLAALLNHAASPDSG